MSNMTYRHQHTNDPHHEREYTEYKYGTNSDHRNSTSFTFTANSDEEEPNVFLDLRKYFSSAPPKVVTKGVRIKRDHHQNQPDLPDEDYICAPSTSRPRRRRSDHLSQAIVPRRHHTTTHSVRHKDIARAESTEYVSPWDKSDYQVIKEGGWTNQQHFMECHGLSIYEPGDFDEAKEILDDYRRADAEAAGENVHRKNHSSRYTERYNPHSKHHSSEDYDDDEAIGESTHRQDHFSHHTEKHHPHLRHRRSDLYRDVGAAGDSTHRQDRYSQHADRYNTSYFGRHGAAAYDDSDLISDYEEDSENIIPNGEKYRPTPRKVPSFTDPQYGSYGKKYRPTLRKTPSFADPQYGSYGEKYHQTSREAPKFADPQYGSYGERYQPTSRKAPSFTDPQYGSYGEKYRPTSKKSQTFVDPQYGSYYGNESRKCPLRNPEKPYLSSDCDSTDAINYYSDSDGQDDDKSEHGEENYADDTIYDDYDDDDDYIY